MSTDFTVEISQNEYVAEGAEDVNAIVTVTSPDTGLAAPVDDQGSAGDYPTGAWARARAATITCAFGSPRPESAGEPCS